MAAAAHVTQNLTPALARGLRPGDIIECPYYMFWHPYIVQSVVVSQAEAELDPPVTVRVIHYGRSDIFEGISVMQENLVIDFAAASTNYRLYRFPEADCRPDDEVVQRALSRVGEAAHNILMGSNNATHFALDCKLTAEALGRYKPTIGRVRMYNPFW